MMDIAPFSLWAPAWKGVPEDWGRGFYRNVPISKWVRKARERHIRDLKRSQEDPHYKYYFDQDAADQAVWFIETFIHHWKGRSFAGKALKLSAWQEWDIIRPIFGWKRKSDGTRRYRKALLMIARKNGKSTLLAAIALYMLVADREPGAQVYCAATKEQQARIVWKDAVKFIKSSPKLRRLLKTHANTILCDMFDSEFKPLGKDSDTQDGLDVHCGIIDEYHAHKDSSMLGVLDTATGTRDQPLIAIISTAGFNYKSPCKEEQDLAEKILDQVLGYEDDEYFAYICTVDDPKKFDDEDEWYKANPQLGLSIQLENFRGKFNSMRKTPSKLREFKVKHLNIWLTAENPWLPLELWTSKVSKIDWSSLKEYPSFLAADVGKSKDLTALAHVVKAPHPEDPMMCLLYLRVFHFCAEETIEERSREDRVPYVAWKDAGYLTATPGRVTRISYVEKKIREVCKEFNVIEVTADGWNALDLLQRLEYDGIKAFEHGQSKSHMAFPCRTFEEMLVDQLIEHEEDPLMDWQIGHAVVIQDANENIKLMKNLSKDRIDGLVGAVMAVGRAMSHEYEHQDLEVFAM